MYTLVLTEQGEAFARELSKSMKQAMPLYPKQEYGPSQERWTVGDDIIHTIALAYDRNPVQALSGTFSEQCDAIVQRLKQLELAESKLVARVGFHLCVRANLVLMSARVPPLFYEVGPVLKALGSPSRLNLLDHLHMKLGSEATALQLSSSMQITRAAIYSHLKILRAVDVVVPSQYQATAYTICTPTLEALAYVLMHAW